MSALAQPSIRRVHVVFKTHLDLGFTDFAVTIARRYREEFIPRALALAKEMRSSGDERFIWTTGSWLIHQALANGTPAQRRALDAGIAAGDIVWHGLPLTTHTELGDAALIRFGLGLARRLDARFGRSTLASKMTDVPGHTRALVPLLAAAGVEFLHLGVNPASATPETPPVFVWRDLATNDEVIVAYQAGGYGDLTLVPGIDEALYFAHTGDNHGPPPAADIRATFAALRERFPGAVVEASTLDAFATAVRAARSSLPVITSEIGDTWIHGVGSDPAKTAAIKALLRWRAARPDPLAPDLDGFNENLLLAVEHTWGLDTKTSFGLFDRYETAFDTPTFRRRRALPRYRRLEKSWREQRAYLKSAIAALPSDTLRRDAHQELAALRPLTFAPGRSIPAGQAITTPHFDVIVDPASGALRRVTHASRTWFNAARPLGRLHYELFSGVDYAWLWKHYNVNHAETASWSKPDFLKPGLEKVVTKSRRLAARLRTLTCLPDRGGVRLLAEGDFGLSAAERKTLGAPARWQILYRFPEDRAAVELTVQWFDKPAVRLAEALWLEAAPVTSAPAGAWRLHKLDSTVDPTDVVRHGNRRLHAAEGVDYHEASSGAGLRYAHPDSPLVAPGGPALVRYLDTPPDMTRGPWFNLYNNTWGTNFPIWYEDDARFRFTVDFIEPS